MSLMLQTQNTWPKLFDDLFGRDMYWPADSRRAFGSLGAVDIEEDAQSVRIHMDVPGMTKEDITLTYERGILSVAGERKAVATAETAHVTCGERSFGRFERRFSLGEKLDSDRIEARVENGVLAITLPKREDVKPKAITIN